MLKTQTDVLRFAAGLEQGAASGYLGMVPLLGDRDLEGRCQHLRRRGDALGDPAPGARREPGARALHLLIKQPVGNPLWADVARPEQWPLRRRRGNLQRNETFSLTR
jgi:hypothetical protein